MGNDKLTFIDEAYLEFRCSEEQWMQVKMCMLSLKLALLKKCREEALALLDNANTIHSVV